MRKENVAFVKRYHNKVPDVPKWIQKRVYDGVYKTSHHWFNVLTTYKNIQLVRYYRVYNRRRRDDNFYPLKNSIEEVIRFWIFNDGSLVCESRPTCMYSYTHSDMRIIKNPERKYYYQHDVYVSRLSDYVKERKFSIEEDQWDKAYFISNLLKNDYLYTLMSFNRLDIISGLPSLEKVKKYWIQIRICLRTGYTADFREWFDMLDCLKRNYIDINNAKNILVNNVHDVIERYRYKRTIKYVENEVESEKYKKHIKPFENLIFRADNLIIRPLSSIKDFFIEGQKMHHCVYACRYYTKENSLIFSAQDCQGNRLATVEYDLSQHRILQCRAACNKTPERYQEICDLVTNELTLITSKTQTA